MTGTIDENMKSRNGKAPDVSITVVAYNSAECLHETLASVREDVRSGLAEVLVVDNASPDESAEIVANEFPEARLIRSETNRGFAGGCNFAWPEARGRYWLLLNPDAVTPPDGLRTLVNWMDTHPEIGAASPELGDGWDGGQCPGRPFPSLSVSLLQLSRLHLLLSSEKRARLLGGHYSAGKDQYDVGFVPGTAMIVRREAIEQAGLLSEDVLIYGEDSEWCARIRRSGWRIGVCAQVSVKHPEGRSTLRTWGEKERTRRIWAGIYDSCRIVRGATYTKLLMMVNAIAFAVEAVHPGRPKVYRENSQKLLRAHLTLLTRGLS